MFMLLTILHCAYKVSYNKKKLFPEGAEFLLTWALYYILNPNINKIQITGCKFKFLGIKMFSLTVTCWAIWCRKRFRIFHRELFHWVILILSGRLRKQWGWELEKRSLFLSHSVTIITWSLLTMLSPRLRTWWSSVQSWSKEYQVLHNRWSLSRLFCSLIFCIQQYSSQEYLVHVEMQSYCQVYSSWKFSCHLFFSKMP